MNGSQSAACNATASASGPGGESGLHYFYCDSANDSEVFPDGAPCHLVILSNAHGRLTREVHGRRALKETHPGAVTVVPKGTPVGWWWDEPLGCSVLALDDSYVTQLTGLELAGGDGQTKLQFVERDEDLAIASIAGMLAGFTAAQGEARDTVWTDSLARAPALPLLRNYAAGVPGRESLAQPERSRAVAKAVAFIERQYQTDMSIEDIADAACLSPYHFSRLFKRETGLSPHQYLIRKRVSAARELLARHDPGSLSEVAAAVGFYDQSHLTRHFKRVFGVTPGRIGTHRESRTVPLLPTPALLGNALPA